MRRDSDYFGERELRLIYVARRLKHALRLEQALADAGLYYVVEPDEYSAGAIFRTVRVGAFFYVASESEAAARETIGREGLRPYEG